MPKEPHSIQSLTEDDVATRELGPQGVPGKPDTHPAPPRKAAEQMPKDDELDGHLA